MYGIFITQQGVMTWMATTTTAAEAQSQIDAGDFNDHVADEECVMVIKLESFKQRLD